MLPDLDALRVEAADADARAEAAAAVAATEEQAAATAQERRRAAAAALEALDRRRQEHEALVIEGRGARAELDAANQLVAEQQAELDALLACCGAAGRIEREAAGVDAAERELEVLAAAAGRGAADTERLVLPAEPPAVDEGSVEAARAAAAGAAERLAGLGRPGPGRRRGGRPGPPGGGSLRQSQRRGRLPAVRPGPRRRLRSRSRPIGPPSSGRPSTGWRQLTPAGGPGRPRGQGGGGPTEHRWSPRPSKPAGARH